MRLRFLTATAVAVMGTAAVLGGSIASNAEDGDSDPAASPSDARLAELRSMDEVRDVGQSVDLQQQPGFGKVRLDFANRQVHLYWKGEPPQDVVDIAGTQPNGVELVLADAPYAQAEMIDSAYRLLDEGRTKDGLPVQAAWPTENLSGLIAMVKPSDLRAERAMRSSSTRRTKLERELRTVAHMPVRIIEGARIVGTSRGNDSPPWQGGGLIYFDDDRGPCTTGFAVITGSGSGRLLSAGHCDNDGNRAVYDGTGNQVIAPGGTSVDVRHVGIDSMIIDPSASPATIGKVFGGAYDQAVGTPRYQYHVGGSGSPQDNDEVCVSGANSGEHCSRRISDPVVAYRCPGNPDVNCTGFRFGSNTGITTVAGDSGGPIYVERADGRVGARGLVSAGFLSDAGDCPSVADGPAYNCLKWAIGVSITDVLAYWRDHGHAGLQVEIE
jgi:hypothetical protein